MDVLPYERLDSALKTISGYSDDECIKINPLRTHQDVDFRLSSKLSKKYEVHHFFPAISNFALFR